LKGQTLNKHLEMMKESGQRIPFDLDFLRELGIKIGKDWDEELVIEYPADISQRMRKLIEKFSEGIKRRLYFENQDALRCFVGGPLADKPHGCLRHNNPFCYNVKRGKWAVYLVKNSKDPRAWFVGYATSKKNGKLLKFIS
jgi:hypothetical protein